MATTSWSFHIRYILLLLRIQKMKQDMLTVCWVIAIPLHRDLPHYSLDCGKQTWWIFDKLRKYKLESWCCLCEHTYCLCSSTKLLFAFLIFTEIIEFKPILRFILEFSWAIKRIRRFVTIREPLSPLFPFVSSTDLIESMIFSPLLQASKGGFESKRSSLSCQTYSTTFSFPFISVQYGVSHQPDLRHLCKSLHRYCVKLRWTTDY